MRPSRRVDKNPPPKVKAFIQSVTNIPLEEIETPLVGFEWDFDDRGHFHHWTELFTHFNLFLSKYVSPRKDLQLSDDTLDEKSPFPKSAVLQILRVLTIIFEHCRNKGSFNGIEHFTHLLSSNDPDILLAALHALAALVRINPSKIHLSGKTPGTAILNRHLLALSQGWGSKEEGLGLFSCISENGIDETGKTQGSTLHFEFYNENRLNVIHISDSDMQQKDDDLLLMKELVEKFQVPKDLRFSLWTRIRYARAFGSLQSRKQYTCLRLLAFMVLVQSTDNQEELGAFFANDTEFMNDIIKVLQAEGHVPDNIRSLSMWALGYQYAVINGSHDRARIPNFPNIPSNAANRMFLLSLLQKAVMSLANLEPYPVVLVEGALYFFLAYITSSSTSPSPMRETGLIPALLPLLKDSNSAHRHLVVLAVRILQKFMDYSSPAISLFRDLGGIESSINRLYQEVTSVIELSTLDSSEYMMCDEVQQIPLSQRRLLKALLKELATSYVPTARSLGLDETCLPSSLLSIFRHSHKFGGDIFASAVTLMSEIIHKDPTCFQALHDAGLTSAFLDAIKDETILPSSKAIYCIPGGLDAICLNSTGLQQVTERNVLDVFVSVFTSSKFLVPLNEGCTQLANSMEELMRHVPSLRKPGVDVIVGILEKIAAMSDTTVKGRLDSPVPMDTDSDEKSTEGHRDESAVEKPTSERFLQVCISHAMFLVQGVIGNPETCKLFVEKKGIDALLRFFTLESIPLSSEWMSIAVHMVSLSKVFSQQHSSAFAKAFCGHLREHLRTTFDCLDPVCGSDLLSAGPNLKVFKCLFVVLFFVFLADATRENRWFASLMSEFGNDSKDVLLDVGRLHREILWQVALLESTKAGTKTDEPVNSVNSESDMDTSANEGEEHLPTSVRQYVDLILNQHRQSSALNSEPQLFDLLQLVYDIGHRPRIRRLNIDSSRGRVGIAYEGSFHPSEEGPSRTKADGNRKKSLHLFCHEILRSLQFYVSHLFAELGKTMHHSRRREEPFVVNPSSKSVASIIATIVQDDLNFEGYPSSGMDNLLSIKCCFLGKVVDLIQAVIVDKQESCNPVMVNYFYAHGVISSVLTTFEATTQLLWTLTQAPEAMESEFSKNKGSDRSVLFGTLSSYAGLMVRLCTPSFLLVSSSHLLIQPVTDATFPLPKDPEKFVKVLQSEVLKVVLPVWCHPLFSQCDVDFINGICQIMKYVCAGVDVKVAKSAGGTSGSQVAGPPLNETSISTIVEMGFTRSRAEEALRTIRSNRVELAMEWLFSHPEEASQEDDELARALALSLGSNDQTSKEESSNDHNDIDTEEEVEYAPPIEEIFGTCVNLLDKDSLAFTLKDLLLALCTHNEGQERNRVISFLVGQLKYYTLNPAEKKAMVQVACHILALIQNEDNSACDVASGCGVVNELLQILLTFYKEIELKGLSDADDAKFITPILLALDGMLQLKKSKKISASDQNDEKSTGADQPKRLDDILDMPEVHMTLEEQKNAIDVVCDYMKIPVHSSAMQALLQFCAKLTRVHEIALLFLEKGGLVALLNLPANSLFPGFDTVASTIIRHTLEDPHTLQLAMESEIRHCFISSSTRSLTGRLSPRSFLSSLSPVISRDPIVFMRAAEVVCQIEMVGERPCVVLCKEKDKEKSKEKEKNPEKEKNLPGDKEKVSFGGSVRISDVCSKAKGHKRPPQTFGVVVEQILDAIIQFTPPEIGDTVSKHSAACSVTDMDVDDRSVENKGKSVVSTDIRSDKDNVPFSLALASFLLKMLTEIVLMYQSAVNVVIRRDTESGQMRGHLQSGASGGRQHGLICHILHTLLPSPVAHSKDKDVNTEWRQRLSSKASQFLLAICVRSSEGRKRIFQEIVNSLNGTSASSLTSPDNQLNTFIDLVNDVLGARSPTGSNITTEVSKALIDVGIPKALSCTLQNLDLDHPDSVIIVDGIVKALESLTMGQIQSSEENQQKDVNEGVSGSNHDDSPSQRGEQETLSADTASHQHQNERASHEIDSFQDSQLGLQSTGNDDDSEEDFMTDSVAEDVGMDTAFSSERGGQDSLVDEDDEDMSGDERDEDGEDEDEEDIEEDELDDDDDDDDDDDEDVHELSHPDPDNEDDHDDVNELGEDEYDEVDFLEDGEDDDDDDDEGNFILRLEDGMDVLEHFDILGRSDGDFPTDPFHVMHIEEVLGANRRQGRTTSIYNLLGRTEDRGTAFQHPLLASPGVSSRSTRRGIENDRTAAENNADSTLASQSLDSIFRTLRNARPGNRMSSWADDSQQHGGLSGNAMAVAIEERFVQRLQQAHPPEETGQAQPQNDETSTKEAGQQGTESADTENVSMSEDQRNAEDQSNNERTEGNNNSNMDNDSTERVQIPSDEPSRQAGAANNDIEMVEQRSERVMLDAEGISQDSGGSGATLGDSLRSLEVEIGSVDGREEGTERVPNADTHSTRTQPLERNQQPTAGDQVSNAGASSDQTLPVDNAGEQQQNTEPNSSSSIDPTFLEALPEEIRTEVLASQRSQAVQSTSNPSPTPEEIDPEFLAALPPDIRAEVLAQQHAQRLLQSHQIDGQPVDMDSASILATFPPDIRAEVLLQSSDAVLANLPETLVSEAQRLRDSLRIGSNSDRLTSFRRGRRNGPGGVRSGTLGIESHRAVSDKMIEPDGKPLLDTTDLKALLRILRIVQSIYKGSLQRLLLNICSYSSSRVALVQLLLDILLPSSEDAFGSTQLSTRERNETTHRLYGCLGDFYSRPQFSDGIPPLVSRRVLETLTNLSQNHPLVANDLLYLKPMDLKNSQGDQQLGHGKAVATEDVTMMSKNPTYPIVLLLNLLNQPLYSRSSVHLEQLLGLVKVILNNVELNKLPVPQTQPGDTDLKPSTEDIGVSKLENSNEKDLQDPCSSSTHNVDAVSVLSNLSETELRLLSSMLAFEGLSELAYSHVSEILMKLVKVVPSHRHLLILQFSSSVEGLSMNAILELKSFGDVESMPLSTPVFGTAILRILQTLSSLSSSEDGRNEKISESENDKNIAMIGNLNTSLEPLWSELSYCISKIESRTSLAISSSYVSNGVMAPLPPGTQKILPYVEAFFVTCEKLQSDQAAATQFELTIATASEVKEAASSSDSIMSPKNMVTQQKKSEEKGTTLIKFVEKHRRLLNAFVRQNPALLEKSFSLLLRVPRLIEFDNKRAYFRSKIRQNQDHQNYSSLRITVRRAYILEDSFNQLRTKQPRELKGRLNVHFQGEEGIDAGGLTREWYQLLSRVIFDKGALLFTTVGNEATFQPNPNSVYQTEHLSYFKFVGRVVAKALFDGQLLDVHFTRSFYKHILGSKVTYHDIEAIDPDYYKNLKWMLENDIRDMPDLTFSMDADEEKLILYEREEVTDHELIPEGRNTRVTEENKHEYVDLVAEHRLTTAIRPQINAFLEGFNELISKDLISIFNDKELELLISGLPEIDLDDLRENTEYTGYSASSPVIQWYWEVVYKFSKEDKARLLQFVTGTSKVPLEGFKALQGITGLQRFQIHKAYGSPDRLPSAHTCFNQLDLPEYTTKEQLEERLLLAIHEGSEGFGFG